MRGKNGRTGQATDDNTIDRKRFACWVTKATKTLGIIMLIAFYGKDGNANVSRFAFIHT